MRKIIISFCILLAALSLKAQSINGIRIDGGSTPILVYLEGNQISLPTTTCFIANLRQGYYTIEVFASRFTRPGERTWTGDRLLKERVFFNGSGVKDIFVNDRNDNDFRPGRPGPSIDRPSYDRYDRVMSDRLFQKFFDDFKNEPFDKGRMNLLNAALANSDFTSEQCLQIVNFYTFDKERMKIMKLMYPRIVDKQAFFIIINTLTFPSSKEEMNKFVRDFNDRRN